MCSSQHHAPARAARLARATTLGELPAWAFMARLRLPLRVLPRSAHDASHVRRCHEGHARYEASLAVAARRTRDAVLAAPRRARAAARHAVLRAALVGREAACGVRAAARHTCRGAQRWLHPPHTAASAALLPLFGLVLAEQAAEAVAARKPWLELARRTRAARLGAALREAVAVAAVAGRAARRRVLARGAHHARRATADPPRGAAPSPRPPSGAAPKHTQQLV